MPLLPAWFRLRRVGLKLVFHGKPPPAAAIRKRCRAPHCKADALLRSDPRGVPSPEVAVGENQYIPLAPSYLDGTFLGVFRFIGGGHVDLTDTFTDRAGYVSQITFHARDLQANGYLLEADADAIIQRAIDSDIGQ